MEENVIKELDTLKGMLNNWKRGFLSWASPDGDNDYGLMEFAEVKRSGSPNSSSAKALSPRIKRLAG